MKQLYYFQATALAALLVFVFTADWYNWIAMLTVYLFMSSLGQSMVYHRCIAHRSWVCPRWYFIFSNIIVTLAGIGSAIAWTAIHLQHHRYSDTEQDPHSPHNHGVLSVYTSSMTYPVNIKYAVGCLKNQTLVWFHEYYWQIHFIYVIMLGVVYPYGIVSLYLAPASLTWLVSCTFNVVCHRTGYRNFNTRDSSTNNRWINWLTLGEGWHNNHHAQPGSYTTKVKNKEYDPLAWIINRIRIDK